MAIQVEDTLSYWNYFLALESDTEHLSRYVEFAERNFRTYSIGLAHLLLAACSEVDVLAEQICEMVDPQQQRENICHYRRVIMPAFPGLIAANVTIPRYGMTLTPCINCGAALCAHCRHYLINSRPWCPSCATQHLPSGGTEIAGAVVFMLKLAAIGAALTGWVLFMPFTMGKIAGCIAIGYWMTRLLFFRNAHMLHGLRIDEIAEGGARKELR